MKLAPDLSVCPLYLSICVFVSLPKYHMMVIYLYPPWLTHSTSLHCPTTAQRRQDGRGSWGGNSKIDSAAGNRLKMRAKSERHEKWKKQLCEEKTMKKCSDLDVVEKHQPNILWKTHVIRVGTKTQSTCQLGSEWDSNPGTLVNFVYNFPEIHWFKWEQAIKR